VPAAAVIRGGRALFILNGRKGCVDYPKEISLIIFSKILLLVRVENITGFEFSAGY
jgi:hypothetical protein